MINFIHKLKPFDRRRHKRFKPSCAIEGVCSYIDSGNLVQCPFGIIDISRGGLKIVTGQQKILPKKQVQVTFRLAPSLKYICLNGEILRTYRRKSENYYYSALQFKSKEAPEIMLLLDFVLNRLVRPLLK